MEKSIDELKATIALKTGIPADLLVGESPKEVLENARMVIELKAEQTPKRKTPMKQFGEYWNGPEPTEKEILLEKVGEIELDALHKTVYPSIDDGGELTIEKETPYKRTTPQQFEEWFRSKL